MVRQVRSYTRSDGTRVSGYLSSSPAAAAAAGGVPSGTSGTAMLAEADPMHTPPATPPSDAGPAAEMGRWKSGHAPSAPAQELLRSWHPDVTLDLAENDTHLTLSRIVVASDAREAGTGSRVMDELCAYADATGKTVACTPSADFGGTKGRLEKFYRRFGFVPNKGRNKDWSTRESMVRPPTQT